VTAQRLQIVLNGSSLTLKSSSLYDLVDSLNLTNARYAVEVNQEIIPKSAIADYTLTNNDVVEIVIAVGGG
jgi:sulfur carrier protein